MIDLKNIEIRKADCKDASVLTKIAFAAKKHWNYPEKYYNIWREELTLTVDYINRHIVFMAIYRNIVLGFYSIVENKSDCYSGEIFIKKGYWLEHIFIDPKYHNLGIGRLLTEHARKISAEREISELLIFADPFAKGFYDKIGCRFLYDSKSSIPGRLIPVYELKI